MDGVSTGGGPETQAQALAGLAETLRDCAKCGLSKGRTQVVFGVGHAEADLMFVGEGPGFHEDRQGEPFVGQAGKLLTELLAGIGLARSDVYIANVVKCRPPENRDPAPDEIEACSPHLYEQIRIITPRVICTLGRFATKLLADTDLSMTAIHGKAKELEIGGVRTLVFPVFHPAAALYAPANKKVLEEDFAKLRSLLTRGAGALAPAEPAQVGSDRSATASAAAPAEQHDAPGEDRRPAADPFAGRPKPATERAEQLHLW